MCTIGPIDPPAETQFQGDNILLQINNSTLHDGSLWLAQNALMWKPVDREDGITIPWRKIVLHAIQNMNNQQTVYAMINFHLIWPGFYQPEREANGHNGAGDAGDDANDDDDDDEMVMEEEDEKLTELRFVPGSQELVNQIYEAMNQCQRLNPDSAANSDDEYFSGEEDEACFDGEEEDDDDEGARDMNNLNLRDQERFADAEED